MFGQDFAENEYISEDFELHGRQFMFPITYIVKNNAESGDEIEIATVMEKGTEERHKALDNYKLFKDEINMVLAENGATAVFKEIYIENTFDTKSSKKYFKEIVDCIGEGDTVFADITFGIKIYSISMFVALNYAVQGTKNADLDTVIYAWKYNSSVKAELAKKSVIYDVTSLFYLNALSGKVSDGERAVTDKLFSC